MTPVRTRIAPSPTGEDLHIGNAYTALINWVVAKKNNGQFIVRIEDTDRARLVTGSEQRILASLDWLGISHDEGTDVGGPYAPYRQSDRLEVYQKHAQELVAKKHAYYCFCTQGRLEEMRKKQESAHMPPMYDGLCKTLDPKDSAGRVAKGEKHVVRLNIPDSGTTTFTDLIRGEISFENKLIDDQVILKSDGFPTYHLGVVVDDHLMEVSHIIRGEEWISSTPKHILLYQFFGWDVPVFAHMPLLRNPDKSKLSKRKNPVWASWFRTQGFLPEAIRNYLALLAWAHPEGKEVFNMDEMMRVFDLTHIQTTAPVFDLEKLRWINGEYIRGKSNEELKSLLIEFGALEKSVPDATVDKVLPLVKERMKTLGEFAPLAEFFFERPKKLERKLNAKLIALVHAALSSSGWTHAQMEASLRAAADKESQRAKDVFMELRIAVTGSSVGPPLLESLEVLGREETLARLAV